MTRDIAHDVVAQLDALLRQPDAPDLISTKGIGRGHQVTWGPYPALRERTFRRAVDAHLADRRGWHATVTRDASVRRHLRAVSR